MGKETFNRVDSTDGGIWVRKPSTPPYVCMYIYIYVLYACLCVYAHYYMEILRSLRRAKYWVHLCERQGADKFDTYISFGNGTYVCMDGRYVPTVRNV
jgi:hypothetical protein